MIIYGYTFTFIYLILLILISTYLSKNKNLDKEITRKIIHIGSSFSWIIMVHYFKTTIHLIIIPIVFIFVNYYSNKKGLISAMERENDSKGTIFYAISLTIMSIITYINNDFLPYYGIGTFIMGLGDGLAGLIGRYSNKKIGKSNKTYLGTSTVFITSIIILIIFNQIYSLNITIISMILLSIASTIIEFFSKKGIDNISLPLGISLLSYIIK